MKKRRKSVKRPHSGNAITATQYEQMTRTFYETRSVTQAATDAGVSVDTARKYVNEGTDRFTAIRDRVSDMDKQLDSYQTQVLVRQRVHLSETVTKLGKRLNDAIENVNVVPKGSYLTDVNGEVIRNADGVPIVQVDEVVFRQLIGSMRDLVGAVNELNQIGQPSGGSGTSVAVGIQILDREAIQSSYKVAARSASGVGGIITAEREEQMREVVRKEALRRAMLPEPALADAE